MQTTAKDSAQSSSRSWGFINVLTLQQYMSKRRQSCSGKTVKEVEKGMLIAAGCKQYAKTLCFLATAVFCSITAGSGRAQTFIAPYRMACMVVHLQDDTKGVHGTGLPQALVYCLLRGPWAGPSLPHLLGAARLDYLHRHATHLHRGR